MQGSSSYVLKPMDYSPVSTPGVYSNSNFQKTYDLSFLFRLPTAENTFSLAGISTYINFS